MRRVRYYANCRQNLVGSVVTNITMARRALFLGVLLSLGVSAWSLKCVAFRATRGCKSTGKRRRNQDKRCNARVIRGEAGYCECEGGKRAHPVSCQHKDFNCNQQCKKLGEKHIEGVAWGPRTRGARPDISCARRCRGSLRPCRVMTNAARRDPARPQVHASRGERPRTATPTGRGTHGMTCPATPTLTTRKSRFSLSCAASGGGWKDASDDPN